MFCASMMGGNRITPQLFRDYQETKTGAVACEVTQVRTGFFQLAPVVPHSTLILSRTVGYKRGRYGTRRGRVCSCPKLERGLLESTR